MTTSRDRSGTPSGTPPARTYHYRLDLEGGLWHEGSAIEDEALIRLYLKTLERDPEGHYFFRCAGELNLVEPDDAPYVVRDVAVTPDAAGGIARVVLEFAAGYTEPLDPATLTIGAGNVLYARVRDGRFPARFSRPAYYRLAERIELDPGGSYVLAVGGRRYPIAPGGAPGQSR